MIISASDQEAIIRGFMPAESAIALLKKAVPVGCADPVVFGEVYRLLLAWTKSRVRLEYAGVENDTLIQALADFKATASRNHLIGAQRVAHKVEALQEIIGAL